MKLIETRVFEIDESILKDFFKDWCENSFYHVRGGIKEKFNDDKYLIDWLVSDGTDELCDYEFCKNEKHDYLLER